MELVLWRHAEAEELRTGITDLQRALTPKGQRQARGMARWLNERLPQDARVLCSPAVRTQQTVAALKRPFETLDALRPDATVAQLLHAARWPQDDQAVVLVVGHQPTLGAVAAHLMAQSSTSWAVKKGAIWWFRLRQRLDRQEVVLQTVWGPVEG
jgi:phosphohistidine phosphatase